MQIILRNLIFIIFLGLTLQGCESIKNFKFNELDLDTKYSRWDEHKLYAKARSQLDKENYQKAIELYETLEIQYPFGDYAAQMQLDVAYAYFKANNPIAAIAAADQFIKIYPRNPNADYAYYLKGLANFNSDIGFVERFLPTDRSQRSSIHTKDALHSFRELQRIFPDSKYTPDAKQRIIALRNNLALYEMHIANFYLRRKAYIAAANRANYVINKYQGTPSIPYALQVIIQSYTELELNDLATDIKQVYKHNYPDGHGRKLTTKQALIKKIWDFLWV